VREAVLAYVAVLAALNTAIKSLDRSVAAHLADHPDGKVFASFPRSGTINAALILAEWGDSRDAYDGPDAVAALGGLVPVTRASGNIAASTSDGRVINACVSLSPPSPTTVGTKASGPQISIDAPVTAARIISTQSGFLLEPVRAAKATAR
jgi:transposase